MKYQCYTQLVRMAFAGLDFSIRKKMVNQQVRDMTQLVERVRRIEQIKYETEMHRRFDKKYKGEICIFGSI